MLSLQAMAKQPGMYDSEVHTIHGVHRYWASDSLNRRTFSRIAYDSYV